MEIYLALAVATYWLVLFLVPETPIKLLLILSLLWPYTWFRLLW